MTKLAKREKLETKYARKKSLESGTLIKIEEGIPKYLTFNDLFISKMMKKKPATFCTVTDLETGERGQIIVSRVLQSKIEENYPAQSYVGKSFEIVRTGKQKGAENDYATFDVYEIDA